ncbi:mitogen-activated protein kinase kinase kinase 3-like [Lotus japonicus]|uniref:mitogen-activated protein kinase kinase kinase 3-like n=1 Tax=Lotus japonicus TaxID=34305 RepID=UPI00258FC128|nr:mitogen-activated protein kinase kinase kinase 3-like [Lotus japonicus]
MPAWWNRKPWKNKQEHDDDEDGEYEAEEVEEAPRSGLQFNFMKSPISSARSSDKKKKKKIKDKKKPKSFDEVLYRNSPRTSKDCDGGAAAMEKKGLPLPRPTTPCDQASISGSSLSSSASASFDDHSISPHFNANRGQEEVKFNVRPKSPCSRGPTSPTSPLHQRLHALSLDSPTGGKQDEGTSQCHPLPLPPGSPTSPSAPCNTRANGVLENNTCNLSKWKKGKLLGRGTFGHVYLGFNSENGQMCAIKEVKVFSDDKTSKECLKQLNQEINLLNQFSHPNIVQYYGSELGEESLSVYLEYVSGGSIHKLLQEYGAFKEPVIQNYTRQIVSGLAYLHSRNTVHRDIKGANILVDPNGEIKLADFGMSKHINSAASMLSFKGSPYWMAPEVVMNTNGYGLPVDIWSLGCTILEMATSKPPWSQFEGVAAIFKIGNSKDMPEIPEHLSDDAKNFIKQCLQRDPLARPTAQSLLNHPFIRDQSATKVANASITRDAFPYMSDGSRTPPVLEPHSNRSSITTLDVDYATKPALAAVRTLRNPRDSTRTITSLPVSPSSSPLRQHRPTHNSPFFSPPHPSYAMMGQSSYTSNNMHKNPARSNATLTLDPWLETSRYKAHTPPGGSPRMRFI